MLKSLIEINKIDKKFCNRKALQSHMLVIKLFPIPIAYQWNVISSSPFLEERFRKNLVAIVDENKQLKERVAELESKLSSQQGEQGRLQRRVRSLEKNNDNLQRAASNFELNRQEMEREVRVIHINLRI